MNGNNLMKNKILYFYIKDAVNLIVNLASKILKYFDLEDDKNLIVILAILKIKYIFSFFHKIIFLEPL